MQRTLVPWKECGLYPLDHDIGTAKLGFVLFLTRLSLRHFLFDILKTFTT